MYQGRHLVNKINEYKVEIEKDRAVVYFRTIHTAPWRRIAELKEYEDVG